MATKYAANIVLSLRRLIRSIDQQDKLLSKDYKMTVPQLVCLRQLAHHKKLTTGQLARRVFLSQATVSGILDRLERKGLINRMRSDKDRRRVFISLTEDGKELIEKMPWPLQERFSQSLSSMSRKERIQLDKTLKRLVKMMESSQADIWLDTGPDYNKKDTA